MKRARIPIRRQLQFESQSAIPKVTKKGMIVRGPSVRHPLHPEIAIIKRPQ